MPDDNEANDLSTESMLPTASPDAPAPSPPTDGSDVVRNAPAAMKRSMPMALSIMVGLLLAVAAGLFFYRLTWFILILYLSFIVATVLEAPVHWLTRRGLRRGLAAMIVMVGGAAIVCGILYVIANGLSDQAAVVVKNLQEAPQKIDAFVAHASKHFPDLGERLSHFHISNLLASIAPTFSSVLTNAMAGIETVSWLVIMFFLVLYMLVDGPDHLKALRALLPKHLRLEATKLFNDIAKAHRGWAVASAANIASSTILTGAGLFLLGIPGAFILGFFAGLGELVPNIGPLLAATPALLLTLIAAPDRFLYVVGMFLIVWTIQGYTISPLMMKFSVRLPVLVTIIAVLVFGTLFGVLGILVSIPLVADMVVLWHFGAAHWEKDSTDYDAVNAIPAECRQPMKAGNTPADRLRKIFRRDLQRDNRSSPPTQPGSMDLLEKTEQDVGPGPRRRK